MSLTNDKIVSHRNVININKSLNVIFPSFIIILYLGIIADTNEDSVDVSWGELTTDYHKDIDWLLLCII